MNKLLILSTLLIVSAGLQASDQDKNDLKELVQQYKKLAKDKPSSVSVIRLYTGAAQPDQEAQAWADKYSAVSNRMSDLAQKNGQLQEAYNKFMTETE